MTIKQLGAKWNVAQDRILLRFNSLDNEEYRLWLSRAIVRMLFKNSVEHITNFLSDKHGEAVVSLIQDFQKEKIYLSINTGQSFPVGMQTPLGAKPVLVINLTLILKRKNSFLITFHLITRQKIEVTLNFDALQSLVYLLNKLQMKADWGLRLDGSAVTDSLSDCIVEQIKNNSFH